MLNIALIGAGTIGRVHAANLSAASDANLCAILDPVPEKAGELAETHDAPTAASLEEALAAADGAIIASSTASHGDVAQACIAAACPFLCEKPLARDLPTARSIRDAAVSGGLIAGVAFNRRFAADYANVRALVGRGALGRVETLHAVSRSDRPPSVAFTRTSGGLFGEKGAHFYDLARWITGEHPEEVFAMGSVLIDPGFADIDEVDTAVVTMRMPSGVLCHFDFSWRAAYGQDERLEVHCAEGMAQSLQAPTGSVVTSTADGQARAGRMPGWYRRFEGSYRIELGHFLQAIRSGRQGELPTLADGVAAQEIAQAAALSVRTGLPVPLPLPG